MLLYRRQSFFGCCNLVHLVPRNIPDFLSVYGSAIQDEPPQEEVHPLKPAISTGNVQQWVEGVMLIPDAEPANVSGEEQQV